ncbi:Hypothetical predicted protein [Olea europaea subsp. europaea]|uniref:Uncharacterized protein n=1 Tax=Olea europaea subsp. europaea TaxID=158383 RepID=A0A8S0S7M8_OLEEU|nr:Hypothetical predicted protein [Olea europaea subsp. europaea]
MEEYLHYMKTLRFQMNDVEDQAAKITVEEQMFSTTIQTLEKDLELAKNEKRLWKEENDQMAKAKGQICLQILEKQKKIASLECDSSTLVQTLDLMQQERLSLAAKNVERSAYYIKVEEDIAMQLKQQKEWANAHKFSSPTGESGSVKEKAGGANESQDDVAKSIMVNLDAAKAKFDQLAQLRFNLAGENRKLRESVELVKSKVNDFQPELRELDVKSLEEELQALLSDKAGETEYTQSLQLKIMKLKEILHVVKCCCGEEYRVKLDLCA